jgi:2-iminobutanoate/2-iminopropanoate deaminase
MAKKIIFTENAPAPIGPYNQAILVNETLYTSGQIALNPISMELVLDSIEIETKQVMENLKAVLKAAEMNFENVVKATIYIVNMNDFSRINTVYASYFNEATAPARETIQVACLPKNVNIEISVVAIK